MEIKIQDLTLNNVTRKVMRNQILDHLWGYDFDSFSNVVDVHIKNLRKKINNGKRKILETVRGIGYKIRDDAYIS